MNEFDNMKMTLSFNELYSYILRQLNFFFPDKHCIVDCELMKNALNTALQRTEECFKHILLKGYSENGNALFNHLHSDQYSQFLYFYANTLWKMNADQIICDKLLYLNRTLHSIFVSYKCNLPEHFVFGHPVGTVIGNAHYNDFLVIFQNVTINTAGDNSKQLPELGKGLFLGTGCKIIGNKPIGDRVSLGVNAFVNNIEIASDSVVLNSNGNNIIRPRIKNKCFAQNYFDIEISQY